MSDYEARPSRRNTPSMSGSGMAAIVLTVGAVLVGFLVLRRINNESGTVTSLGNGSASAVGASNAAPTPPTDAAGNPIASTTAPPAPTTPPQPTTFAGATVLVANANKVGGSAGRVTTLLDNKTDFAVAPAKNAAGDKNLDTSKVYYSTTAELTAKPVAENLGRILGGVAVEPLPSEGDVVDGGTGQANVVLMLGNDKAEIKEADLVPPLTANDAANSGTTATSLLPSDGTTTTAQSG